MNSFAHIFSFICILTLAYGCDMSRWENQAVIIKPPTSHSETIISYENTLRVKIDSLGGLSFANRSADFKRIEWKSLDTLLVNFQHSDSTGRFAIIADSTVDYKKVKELIDKFQNLNIKTFNLITDLN